MHHQPVHRGHDEGGQLCRIQIVAEPAGGVVLGGTLGENPSIVAQPTAAVSCAAAAGSAAFVSGLGMAPRIDRSI